MAKVLFCLPRFHTNAAPWVRLLQDAGHEVAVHVQRAGPVEDHARCAPQIIPAARWALLIDRLLPKPNDAQLRHAPPLRDYWRRLRADAPDVVIVRGITRWFCLAAAVMALVQGRRVVVYDQDAPAPTFPSGTWLRRALCRAAGMHRITARADVTQEQARGLAAARTLPFAAAKCSEEMTTEARHRIAQDAGVGRILMVGKYRQRKGHAALIDALAELAPRRYFTLTFCAEEVSDADRAFRAALEQSAFSAGIGARVRFVANASREEMARLYAGHAIFVLPSLDEPAAVSPIEAVWHGAFAMMDEQAGTRHYLPPGNGFAFDARVPLDIARALDPVLAQPAFLRARRAACLDHLQAMASDAAVRAVLEQTVLGMAPVPQRVDLPPQSRNCRAT